jgi:hypothetical protein
MLLPAHIMGIPIEEMLGTLAPGIAAVFAASLATGKARRSARRLGRWRRSGRRASGDW